MGEPQASRLWFTHFSYDKTAQALPERTALYYLCDEGGMLPVYACGADGDPADRLEETGIYVILLPEYVALRSKQGLAVYSETELHARYEIMLENYSKVLRIEALTMLEMVNTDILPAVSDYTAKLVRTAEDKKALLGSAAGGYEQKTAARLSSLTEIASEDAAKLDDALLQAGDLPTAQEAASFYQAEVFKDMTELRLAVDELETLSSRACWP